MFRELDHKYELSPQKCTTLSAYYILPRTPVKSRQGQNQILWVRDFQKKMTCLFQNYPAVFVGEVSFHISIKEIDIYNIPFPVISLIRNEDTTYKM